MNSVEQAPKGSFRTCSGGRLVGLLRVPEGVRPLFTGVLKRRLLHMPDDGEDLVQESLLAIHREMKALAAKLRSGP